MRFKRRHRALIAIGAVAAAVVILPVFVSVLEGNQDTGTRHHEIPNPGVVDPRTAMQEIERGLIRSRLASQEGEMARLEIEARDREVTRRMGEHERAWATGRTREEMRRAEALGVTAIPSAYPGENTGLYTSPDGTVYEISPYGTARKIAR